ncbi:hypothetical protein [Sphingomonas elodea]|uniref:hypothetical protein n=1 Tax=Sphingomonas elodea TaxID=179878 RepID=UPI00026316E5|nr:hypothetical protein [Sphingomonas elodea]
MLYDHAVFDTSLATAVEQDPALIAELQRAFLESMRRAADVSGKEGDAAHWAGAALHLQRLAGSCGMPGVDAAVRQTLDGALIGRRSSVD